MVVDRTVSDPKALRFLAESSAKHAIYSVDVALELSIYPPASSWRKTKALACLPIHMRLPRLDSV